MALECLGRKRGKAVSFSFVQITDHHLLEADAMLTRGYSPAHAFRTVLRHIAEHQPHVDFVVTTGDLVEHGTDAEYQQVRRILGLRELSAAPGPQRATAEGLHEMPMYFLPGNHDPREAFFRNMFPAFQTEDQSALQMNASFMHKGIQFICVDWGNANKAVSTPTMLENLACSLSGDTPSIILSHHNVSPMGLSRLNAMVADDIEKFGSIIRGKPVLAILAGHTHATYEASIAAIPVYGLRSTYFSFAQSGDEWCFVLRPPHYRVVSVSERTLTTEIVEVPL